MKDFVRQGLRTKLRDNCAEQHVPALPLLATRPASASLITVEYCRVSVRVSVRRRPPDDPGFCSSPCKVPESISSDFLPSPRAPRSRAPARRAAQHLLTFSCLLMCESANECRFFDSFSFLDGCSIRPSQHHPATLCSGACLVLGHLCVRRNRLCLDAFVDKPQAMTFKQARRCFRRGEELATSRPSRACAGAAVPQRWAGHGYAKPSVWHDDWSGWTLRSCPAFETGRREGARAMSCNSHGGASLRLVRLPASRASDRRE